MIAVSDAVLVLVSAVALGSGLYSWKNNIEQASRGHAVTTAPAAMNERVSAAESSSNVAATVPAPTAVQQSEAADSSTSTRVLLAEPEPVTNINVNSDSATAASNNATVDARPYGAYIVQSGDSLSLIAERFATTVRTLQEVNELSGTLITVGQELRYPLPAN